MFALSLDVLCLIIYKGEYFLASDASAVVEHTKEVEFLKDNEMVVISRAGYIITDIDVDHPTERSPAATLLEMSLDAIEKGGHKHFMLKEIMEQVREGAFWLPKGARNSLHVFYA